MITYSLSINESAELVQDQTFTACKWEPLLVRNLNKALKVY